MKRFVFTAVLAAAAWLAVSCVSLQDREASRDDEVLETIQVTFTSYQPLQFIVPKEKIKEKAYEKLLEQAEQKYQGDIDIANIRIKGKFSAWTLLTMLGGYMAGGGAGGAIGFGISQTTDAPETTIFTGAIGGAVIGFFTTGNFQKITATGDIIATGEYRALSQSTRAGSNTRMTPLRRAVHNASDAITLQLPEGSVIALLNIESADKNITEQVIDELEYILVSSRNFTMVNRRTLDAIMSEQNFQLSGNVDDNEAVSIGKMTGANIVITGAVSGTGSNRRLTLRALDVQTGQIMAMARENF